MRIPAFFTALLLSFLATTAFAQKNKPADAQKIVTGTILLNDKTPVDNKAFLAALKTDWGIRTDSVQAGEKTLVFSLPNNTTVMIAWLNYPAAPAEIKAAADISMIWPGAADEAGRHQSQAVVSVIGPASRTVELYKLFTKISAALLDNTRSSGIYLSSQYLLVPKGYFIESARGLNDQVLPLSCWIYFGLQQNGDKNSGYTYGMGEFGLPEFEVVNSEHAVQEVYALLTDAVDYVIRTNTRFQEGQYFNAPNGEKIQV
ncbi:MAG TPA: DUF4261 domain-containing protein, partial [Saprospiraceae bacterium]|nr:DUF4261 domain-containing protein [Saprospiraceae bacterium]